MNNNKGFAVTTIVYAIVILLSLSMFLVLTILKGEYTDQKEFVEDIQTELDTCLGDGSCL